MLWRGSPARPWWPVEPSQAAVALAVAREPPEQFDVTLELTSLGRRENRSGAHGGSDLRDPRDDHRFFHAAQFLGRRSADFRALETRQRSTKPDADRLDGLCCRIAFRPLHGQVLPQPRRANYHAIGAFLHAAPIRRA